jgi:hypothetical protein
VILFITEKLHADMVVMPVWLALTGSPGAARYG